jgi:hypothetical protein
MSDIGGTQIAANSTQDFLIAVRPVVTGMKVIVCPRGALDSSWVGLVWCAWVNGADQVTVRLANVTTSPITPIAAPFVVRVFPEGDV